MANISPENIRSRVRNNYGKVSDTNGVFGCSPTTACCSPGHNTRDISSKLGYSDQQLDQVPENSNLGLGCGNPQAIAALKRGETVLDLGSGAGFDLFLASQAVGKEGKAIGVDMTPEMVEKARNNKAKGDYPNVEFRLGEIEHLPVENNSVDVIISNCVINLSPEKEKVFSESYRVLRSGGRLAISDVVTTAELPDHLKGDLDLLSGCVSGAESVTKLEKILKQTGFIDISIRQKNESAEFLQEWVPGTNIQDYIVSATIEAIKP